MHDVNTLDVDAVQSITKSDEENPCRTITRMHEYRTYKPAMQMTIRDAGVNMDSNVE